MRRWNKKQIVYDPEGRLLPEELTERLNELLWEIIEEAVDFSKDASNEKGDINISVEESLYDFIKRRAEELVYDEKERRLLLKMSEMFGAYIGEVH